MNKTYTNLKKTKEQIIYELVISLNQGDSYYCSGNNDRINIAIMQYEKLVNEGVIKEIEY